MKSVGDGIMKLQPVPGRNSLPAVPQNDQSYRTMLPQPLVSQSLSTLSAGSYSPGYAAQTHPCHSRPWFLQVPDRTLQSFILCDWTTTLGRLRGRGYREITPLLF
jgi:hypothetical protein